MVRHIHADQELADQELNSPLIYGDQHVDKPKKAVLGLGLLLAIALALYGFNAAHRERAVRASSVALSFVALQKTATSAFTGFDTAHLAPREDTSLR